MKRPLLIIISVLTIAVVVTAVFNKLHYLHFFIQSGSNLWGVPLAVFSWCLMQNKTSFSFTERVLFVVLALIIYEWMQYFLPWGTFDLLDISACFAGGGLAFLIFLLLQNQKKTGLKHILKMRSF